MGSVSGERNDGEFDGDQPGARAGVEPGALVVPQPPSFMAVRAERLAGNQDWFTLALSDIEEGRSIDWIFEVDGLDINFVRRRDGASIYLTLLKCNRADLIPTLKKNGLQPKVLDHNTLAALFNTATPETIDYLHRHFLENIGVDRMTKRFKEAKSLADITLLRNLSYDLPPLKRLLLSDLSADKKIENLKRYIEQAWRSNKTSEHFLFEMRECLALLCETNCQHLSFELYNYIFKEPNIAKHFEKHITVSKKAFKTGLANFFAALSKTVLSLNSSRDKKLTILREHVEHVWALSREREDTPLGKMKSIEVLLQEQGNQGFFPDFYLALIEIDYFGINYFDIYNLKGDEDISTELTEFNFSLFKQAFSSSQTADEKLAILELYKKTLSSMQYNDDACLIEKEKIFLFLKSPENKSFLPDFYLSKEFDFDVRFPSAREKKSADINRLLLEEILQLDLPLDKKVEVLKKYASAILSFSELADADKSIEKVKECLELLKNSGNEDLCFTLYENIFHDRHFFMANSFNGYSEEVWNEIKDKLMDLRRQFINVKNQNEESIYSGALSQLNSTAIIDELFNCDPTFKESDVKEGSGIYQQNMNGDNFFHALLKNALAKALSNADSKILFKQLSFVAKNDPTVFNSLFYEENNAGITPLDLLMMQFKRVMDDNQDLPANFSKVKFKKTFTAFLELAEMARVGTELPSLWGKRLDTNSAVNTAEGAAVPPSAPLLVSQMIVETAEGAVSPSAPPLEGADEKAEDTNAPSAPPQNKTPETPLTLLLQYSTPAENTRKWETIKQRFLACDDREIFEGTDLETRVQADLLTEHTRFKTVLTAHLQVMKKDTSLVSLNKQAVLAKLIKVIDEDLTRSPKEIIDIWRKTYTDSNQPDPLKTINTYRYEKVCFSKMFKMDNKTYTLVKNYAAFEPVKAIDPKNEVKPK